MPLGSVDDLLAALVAEQKYTALYHKTHVASGAGTAGRWYDLFQGTGIPTAGSYSGTAGVAVALTDQSAGAIWHGGDVSPAQKRLASAFFWTPTSTVVTATAWLVDMLLYYPSLVTTGTPTTLDNTVTLPRYTSGEGLRAFGVVTSAFGNGTPSWSFTYTAPGPTGGRSSGAYVAQAVNLPTPTIVGTRPPWIPLQAGDQGLTKIDSYTINSGGVSGNFALVICKPLELLPVYAINRGEDREFITGKPSFERIYDGACLGVLINPGGNMANASLVNLELKTVWD